MVVSISKNSSFSIFKWKGILLIIFEKVSIKDYFNLDLFVLRFTATKFGYWLLES